MAWSLDFGAFDNLPHARNAYDALKRDRKPRTAGEWWPLWIADCVARKASLLAADDGNGNSPALLELHAELDRIAAGDEKPLF